MPADLVLRVEPNDDPMLSCWLCGGRSDHIPRPLMTTFHTPEGRTSVGLHQRCYDRAMTPIAPMTVTPKDQETADKSRSFSGGGKHEA